LEGILAVNKPLGMTSFDMVFGVRRLFSGVKVGHIGTLDPLASGLLVMALGQACKTIEYMEDYPKSYLAEVSFGTSTSTYDAEGQITQQAESDWLNASLIKSVLSSFRGPISQKPPIFSALKRNGQKLYELARKGQTLELQSRPVEIYELSLLNYQNSVARLQITCSKGTYIRSLAHDLGQVLGCPAHLSYLLRTQCGPFRLEEAWQMEDLERFKSQDRLYDALLPIDSGIQHLPMVELSQSEINEIRYGRAISYNNHTWPPDQAIRMYYNSVFQAIGRYGNCSLIPSKVFG